MTTGTLKAEAFSSDAIRNAFIAGSVKFKALVPGQRFRTAAGVPMIKLNRTLAGITDAAGNVASTHTVLPNERVEPAPPMVAHATPTSKAAVTLVQGIERTAMRKRWSEAQTEAKEKAFAMSMDESATYRKGSTKGQA